MPVLHSAIDNIQDTSLSLCFMLYKTQTRSQAVTDYVKLFKPFLSNIKIVLCFAKNVPSESEVLTPINYGYRILV